MSVIYRLAGRQFKPVTHSTLEHDFHVMDVVRSSGLDHIRMDSDADPADFAMELISKLVRSGSMFRLLGCTLLPAEAVGSSWTPAMAEETAEFMRSLTDDQDKTQVQKILVKLICDFFQTGLVVVKISPKSSVSEPSPSAEDQYSERAA